MKTARQRHESDIDDFYAALTQLARSYQFRDRDRQTICGITVTQCYTLDFLAREGRLTVLDIGRRLALDKSNASRVVNALERLGLVSRALDPANHRIRWIEPTPDGRRVHAQITDGLKREYALILQPFSASFIRRVNRLLVTLAGRARVSPRQDAPRGVAVATRSTRRGVRSGKRSRSV